MKTPLLIMTIIVAVVIIALAIMLLTFHAKRTAINVQRIGLVTIPMNVPRIFVNSAFANGSQIPPMYTCDGANISIPITLGNIPSNAKSIMVIIEDLNAPGGVFIHWVLYDIPPNVTQIQEGLPTEYYIPGIGYQGVNDFGKIGYGGPCPPPGPPHEYVVIVLALNITINPAPNLYDREIINSLNVHDVVGYGILIGYYGHG